MTESKRSLGSNLDKLDATTDEDIARIAGTYHAWRREGDAGEYQDLPGFCRSATLKDLRKHAHVLTPGLYVLTIRGHNTVLASGSFRVVKAHSVRPGKH